MVRHKLAEGRGTVAVGDDGREEDAWEAELTEWLRMRLNTRLTKLGSKCSLSTW